MFVFGVGHFSGRSVFGSCDYLVFRFGLEDSNYWEIKQVVGFGILIIIFWVIRIWLLGAKKIVAPLFENLAHSENFSRNSQ
jgi:hypothetical protein